MAFHQACADIRQPAIGSLIRKLRQTLKLAQEEFSAQIFSAQIGVTFLMIDRWDDGHALPSPLTLKQIDSLLKQSNQSPDLALRKLSQELQVKYFLQRKSKNE
ncbi:MAG: hypothetical protein KME11_12980 [Timaviella obliquedivisa GSE-PSE-MK23-08B]|jgi:DNA-binding transcriptional regulator YiaG|nr:hypothetical protein [Timaviella obliquedivisa GSE-PSE-MK23-08B]